MSAALARVDATAPSTPTLAAGVPEELSPTQPTLADQRTAVSAGVTVTPRTVLVCDEEEAVVLPQGNIDQLLRRASVCHVRNEYVFERLRARGAPSGITQADAGAQVDYVRWVAGRAADLTAAATKRAA